MSCNGCRLMNHSSHTHRMMSTVWDVMGELVRHRRDGRQWLQGRQCRIVRALCEGAMRWRHATSIVQTSIPAAHLMVQCHLMVTRMGGMMMCPRMVGVRVRVAVMRMMSTADHRRRISTGEDGAKVAGVEHRSFDFRDCFFCLPFFAFNLDVQLVAFRSTAHLALNFSGSRS